MGSYCPTTRRTFTILFYQQNSAEGSTYNSVEVQDHLKHDGLAYTALVDPDEHQSAIL